MTKQVAAMPTGCCRDKPIDALSALRLLAKKVTLACQHACSLLIYLVTQPTAN
jgi:hypothetical protein